MPTVVRACDCVHSYQDKKYGSGQRVHNEGKKDHVCTVCGKKRTK